MRTHTGTKTLATFHTTRPVTSGSPSPYPPTWKFSIGVKPSNPVASTVSFPTQTTNAPKKSLIPEVPYGKGRRPPAEAAQAQDAGTSTLRYPAIWHRARVGG